MEIEIEKTWDNLYMAWYYIDGERQFGMQADTESRARELLEAKIKEQ